MSSETKQKSETVSISFICAAGTDVGRRRETNEDVFVFDAINGFFMVVDGMGGHEKGEVAAKLAAETIQTAIRKIENSPEIRLRDAIIMANNAVSDYARSNSWEMGCVLTALLIEENRAYIGHIGDTRLYKIRRDIFEKLTVDHSFVGELEETGELSERRLLEHPQRNEVSRGIGFEEKSFEDENFTDIFQTEFENDTAFLLCSDGLSDLLTTKQISRIIRTDADSPKLIVENLISEANELGGKDNITVIFIAGQEFAAETLRHKETFSKKYKFQVLLKSRWSFLIYGILIGAALVYWLWLQIF